jgi:hypothetical protein
MWSLYTLALLPLIIGFFVWLKCDKVNWVEWAGSSILALILAGVTHGIAIHGMTADTEVWSGQITRATHYPKWIEEYQQAHTYTTTDSKGRSTSHTYYTTEHRTHPEYWEAKTDLETAHNISKDFFEQISHNFNNLTTEKPHKGGFDGGDPHIYVAYNKTGYVYPVTTQKHFTNRIKAAPTVFSYPKIPADIKVVDYPYPAYWNESNRLINEPNISIINFDRFNTRLGFKKWVNVIFINCGDVDPEVAQYQEAKFIGGKKNDIVVCYGKKKADQSAGWVYVFGWTEEEICKRDIETVLLNNPINNHILPLVEREIIEHYIIKDWTKFSYISIDIPLSVCMWYFLGMIIIQAGLYYWFVTNEVDKEGVRYNRSWSRYGY